VLTDGYENASHGTQNQIFKKAIDNNIAVFTIGMGKTVDVQFLRSIATGTNGGYYWIEDNKKLNDVFADIYKNMKNYYTLRFNTPYPGKYKITLRLCKDKNNDSLVYYFNNFVPDLLYNTNQFETDSLFNEITGIGDTLYREDFNTERIYENIEFKELEDDFNALIFPNIKFDYNKTTIVSKTDNELVNVIAFMNKHPNCRVEIQGHTDDKGELLFNEKLSQVRAETVKLAITVSGITPERIQTRGYGETKPIFKNNSEEGRQKNRRVEFILVKVR